MNGWNEYLMKQEQYRDQARDAARHRLVKGCQDAVLRHTSCQDAARRSEPTRLRDVQGQAA
jgi:hypothetical protein